MKKILVVDDEAGIRDMLAEYFLNRGYHVFSAGNLSEARAILSRESPKVVIFDLDLNGEWGGDILHEIKTNLPATKVIIFTANENPELPKKLLAQGADFFLTKSGPIKIIERKVEEYCADEHSTKGC